MTDSELKDRLPALRTSMTAAAKALNDALNKLEDKKLTSKKSPPGAGSSGAGGNALMAKEEFDADKARRVFAEVLEVLNRPLEIFTEEYKRFLTDLAADPTADPQTSAAVASATTAAENTSQVASMSKAATDVSASFSEFIQAVGASVADAQRSLDEQSRTYLKGDAKGRPPLPAVFRIPKLSAEMRFALQRESDKRLNLLFFSSKEKAAAEHQQSISFDIVSAPPPPELLAAMAQLTPSLNLVLDPGRRGEVFNLLATLSKAAPAKHELNRLYAEDNPSVMDRVLLIEAGQPRHYLAFAAAPEQSAEDYEVGIWLVSVDTTAPAVTPVLGFLNKGPRGTEQGPLRQFVNALADQQEKYFKALRGS